MSSSACVLVDVPSIKKLSRKSTREQQAKLLEALVQVQCKQQQILEALVARVPGMEDEEAKRKRSKKEKKDGSSPKRQKFDFDGKKKDKDGSDDDDDDVDRDRKPRSEAQLAAFEKMKAANLERKLKKDAEFALAKQQGRSPNPQAYEKPTKK